MKRLAKIIFLLLLINFGNCLYAQQKIKPLKIGDRVPDLVLTNILNHSQSIRLSSLHAQDLLIINFWATWCVPCIREMPLLDSLVASNKGNLKVLSVAYENATIVRAFLKKHSTLPTSNLVIATNDKILIEYFKHRVIPHNIWIDKYGVIRNITGSEEINLPNVTAFINRGRLNTHEKADHIDFDFHKTFHLKDSDFFYRSILTGFTDGINGGVSYQSVWGHPTERWLIRLFSFNASKKQLLWRALNQMNSYNDYYGIMKIITKDSTRFFWPTECPKTYALSKYHSKLDWEKDNAYCYELTLPKAVVDSEFFGYMKSDLERTLQVKISIQNQIIPCSILTVEKGRIFDPVKNDTSYIDLGPNKLMAYNVTPMHLFHFLNEKIKADANKKPIDPPYIDQTNIEIGITIEINFSKLNPDFKEIKELIRQKYGLLSSIQDHSYPIFIIKDLAQ